MRWHWHISWPSFVVFGIKSEAMQVFHLSFFGSYFCFSDWLVCSELLALANTEQLQGSPSSGPSSFFGWPVVCMSIACMFPEEAFCSTAAPEWVLFSAYCFLPTYGGFRDQSFRVSCLAIRLSALSRLCLSCFSLRLLRFVFCVRCCLTSNVVLVCILLLVLSHFVAERRVQSSQA
jgi:hypothetical protein